MDYDIADIVKRVIAEIKENEEAKEASTTPEPDWIAFGRQLSKNTEDALGFFTSLGDALMNVYPTHQWTAATSLVSKADDVLYDFGVLIKNLAKASFKPGDLSEVNWKKFCFILRKNLGLEDKEDGVFSGVTTPEFFEALGDALRAPFGLHLWHSKYEETPRLPITADKIAWFLGNVFSNLALFLGEKPGLGEKIKKEEHEWFGGDTPWSMP